jgi:hypothetical protein
MREETNVSDGPPVEHSIMKRAWPYALALAVVVTGCYLALAPLLRSLSPDPTTSATSRQLTQGSDTVTVGQQAVKQIKFNSPVKVGSTFVGNLKTTKKKKVKKPVTTPTATTGFANNPPSSSSSSSSSRGSSNSSSSSSSSSSTPKSTPKTTTPPAKTASKGARSVGGGSVDQATDGGFAGGNSSGSMTLGQKPEAGN